MGNVGKRAAMHKGRGVLQGLHQVGLQRVLQQRSHCALGVQVTGGDGLAVAGVGNHQASQARLQVADVGSQAQNSHDLGGNGDVIAVLTGHTVGLAAQAVHHEAELTVVHIHAAAPYDLTGVDVQSVALIDVVIQHGGQQVVGSADGVEVTGKVQVDVLHRDDLSVAAAGSAALNAKHRSQRGLTQSDNYVLTQLAHTVGQAHSGSGLAFASGGGVDGGDEDQLAVGLIGLVLQDLVVNLGLVLAVLLQILLVHAGGLGDLGNGLHDSFLCNFDVSFESHVNHISLYCVIGALPLVWPRRIQDLCGSPLE